MHAHTHTHTHKITHMLSQKSGSIGKNVFKSFIAVN